MRGRGFRQLRPSNHSGPFYQHRPDWPLLSAEEKFDRTFSFFYPSFSFFKRLSQCWAGWWLLHDHISGLTARFTTLLAHSKQTMRSHQELSAGSQCHLDLKAKMRKKNILKINAGILTEIHSNLGKAFLLSVVSANLTVNTSSIGSCQSATASKDLFRKAHNEGFSISEFNG